LRHQVAVGGGAVRWWGVGFSVERVRVHQWSGWSLMDFHSLFQQAPCPGPTKLVFIGDCQIIAIAKFLPWWMCNQHSNHKRFKVKNHMYFLFFSLKIV